MIKQQWTASGTECVKKETSEKGPAWGSSLWSGSQNRGVCGCNGFGLRRNLGCRCPARGKEHRALFFVQGKHSLTPDSHLHAHILTHLPTFLHTHGSLSVVLRMRCPPPDEETLRLSQEAVSPQTHRGSVAESDQHLSAPFRSGRSYPNLVR